MKKRFTPVITIGIFVILIGSIAYAADRRKKTKQENQPLEPVHEEEALTAELLDAVQGNEKKLNVDDNTGKIVGDRVDEKTNQSKSARRLQ